MGRSALLVMDFQRGVVGRLGDAAEHVLAAVGRAADAARDAGVRVIFVRVAFREGTPEISDRNRIFAAIGNARSMGFDDEATAIHPAVAPRAEDVVVVKKRISAFVGSDLEVVLRSLDVDHLVLTGISTSGVVLSTLRQAADLDYALTVLRDGCADTDDEVHRVLLEKVFPRQADVRTVDEWAAQLTRR